MIEPWLEHWLSGVPPAGWAATAARQVIMVERTDPPNSVVYPGARDAIVVVRSTSSNLAPDLRWYTGSFVALDADIRLAGGQVITSKPYGVAEFLSFDQPTVLRVADDADFSAYLRDADIAWRAGDFADGATHPMAIIADLAGLGGPWQRAGPADRLLVLPDGTASTSPTGVPLGSVGDPLETIVDAWDRASANSPRPCAVCLARAVPERDRVDELLERPWLSRYLVAARAIRAARKNGRLFRAVSGFGGRLADRGRSADGGAEQPAVVDADDAPVLLVDGDVVWAQDPAIGRFFELPPTLGRLLDRLTVADAVRSTATGPDAVLTVDRGPRESLRRLAADGFCAAWFRRMPSVPAD